VFLASHCGTGIADAGHHMGNISKYYRVRFGVVTAVPLKFKSFGADYSCVAGHVVSDLLLRSFKTI
jgi:hypothetical protein